MTYLETVPEDEAAGLVAELYAEDLESDGYVWNLSRIASLHPEVLTAWRELVATMARGMDNRTYELATLAAARRRRSSYCSLAHGDRIATRFHTAAEVTAIATGAESAPLDERDRAVIAFADHVADDAASVTAEEIERLRAVGMSDREIFDVAAAVGARLFLTALLDGLGVLPDAAFHGLDPALREALTVGRPIDDPR